RERRLSAVPSDSGKRATAPTLSGRIPAIAAESPRPAEPNRLMVGGDCCAATSVALLIRIKASAIGSPLALGIAHNPSAAYACPASVAVQKSASFLRRLQHADF